MGDHESFPISIFKSKFIFRWDLLGGGWGCELPLKLKTLNPWFLNPCQLPIIITIVFLTLVILLWVVFIPMLSVLSVNNSPWRFNLA